MIPSTTENCKEREEARKVNLQKRTARRPVSELAGCIQTRRETLWILIPVNAIKWLPEDGNETNRLIRAPLRDLLFHVSTMFDVNECELDFLNFSDDERHN